MKLLTFEKDGQLALGVKLADGIFDVAASLNGASANVPKSIHEVIDGGEAAVSALQQHIDASIAKDGSKYVLDESKLSHGPAVSNPKKIICIGLNYRKHAEETNSPIPTYPILFNKFHNTITANGKDVPLPPTSITSKVDYEAELGIVIGKQAKYVSKENALDYVFGYCNVNDLSARDLQLRTPQWLTGKSLDGFSPVGPYLVTADEVGNPNDLEIRTIVNGEVRQDSNTSDMIFHCDELVSYVSQYMTLVPGDIILTGTPEGVVMGYPEDKQVYLKDGDVVTIEIEKLGSLTNTMVNEK